MSNRSFSFLLVVLLCNDVNTAVAEEFGLDFRPSNTSCIVHDRPVDNAALAAQSMVLLDNDGVSKPPLAMVQAPGDSSRWFVLSQPGKVTEYLHGDSFTRVGTFLDITDRVTTTFFGQNAEFGALGIAFHPDFEQNGHVFIYYTAAGDPYTARVSRFTSEDNGLTVSPDSEEIFLSLPLTDSIHIAGNIAFGQDGYLYIGVGDGGFSANAQDLNSLMGKMLRIDVDSGSPYAIPPDNPWADGGGRGEIYAYGFRNPWRWSFDKFTGELWLGDVGAASWEEIDLVVRAGNYGWPIREGMHCFGDVTCDSEGLIDPVVEYSHNGGSAAVIGGFVYRGQSIPGLHGVYLYMDSLGGRLWALFYDEQGEPQPELLLELGNSFSMAEGNDGELYVLQYNRPKRLVAQGAPPADPFPLTLSQTGCFDPADLSTPASGLIPYDVNVALWSDGAEKERWMALADGTTIDVDASNDWIFPIGTVLVKSFRLSGQLIETRLMMRHLDGEWAGYSYEWNDSQTEAYLLPAGKTKTINGIVWQYPSRGECLRCHTQVATIALGPETAQLNSPFVYPATGREANQLETLEHIGMFDSPLQDDVENLPRLPGLIDEMHPVDKRARGYLHANCAMCHQPGGPGQGPMDFRYTVAGLDMGALNVIPTQGDFGISDARLLSPGHAQQSIISYRVNTLGTGRMPPLATAIADPVGTQIIDRWINSGLGFGIPDTDGDELADNLDNCPTVSNSDQMDTDMDGVGDSCDAFISDPTESEDSDADLVGNNSDNCTLVSNDSQLDTDFDGFGNFCDADFNNDGIVNILDLSLLKARFLTADADTDINGDGMVNPEDLGLFKTMFFNPPGPSCCAP